MHAELLTACSLLRVVMKVAAKKSAELTLLFLSLLQLLGSVSDFGLSDLAIAALRYIPPTRIDRGQGRRPTKSGGRCLA